MALRYPQSEFPFPRYTRSKSQKFDENHCFSHKFKEFCNFFVILSGYISKTETLIEENEVPLDAEFIWLSDCCETIFTVCRMQKIGMVLRLP